MLEILTVTLLLITSSMADEVNEDDLFKCSNGTYIPKEGRCDGYGQCIDGEDEIGCSEFECRGHVCKSEKRCVPKFFRCNGEKNCDDNSDEIDCHLHECDLEHDFRCGDFSCIPNAYMCDGYSDCSDGFDEIHCDELIKCEADQWRCNHQCIPNESLCDDIRDCRNGEDEAYCIPCDPDSHFRCKNFKCIRRFRVCNGVYDCSDRSDEMNCENFTLCQSDKFRCNNRCISKERLCDGVRNCINGEDEVNCTPCNNETHFKCQNSECILKSQLCDGNDDCTDKSDENNCDNEDSYEIEEKFVALPGKVSVAIRDRRKQRNQNN